MTFTDSRQGPGTLTLGGTDFGVQATNVRLVPAVDETDGTPTLANPEPDPTTEAPKWTLEGTAIQDWSEPTGFIEYCRDNSGTSVAFAWVPNTDAGVTFSGNCVVKALEIGGDVASENTSDWSFRVVGQPSRVDA